ncbi:MAG: quinol:cytochrome C oxidoreductase [Chitinophagaceae bacterium]|nr:quinol:cytochrome C oxidoreductase [Chitinophagaceae bacterium]OQY92439.1 MAG: quinol:cytochrome C oxidoreductase [Sphingobacteriales bacterium UTBCD1]
MVIKEQFIVTKRYRSISMLLMAVGILAIIALYIAHGSKSDPKEQARFWGSLLQNSVYFLLLVNTAMFFICSTILSWGGWQMSFRRVTEAISACVPVIGVICAAILFAIVFGNNHEIYRWADARVVNEDEIIQFKSGFLNKGFFVGWTIFTIGSWALIGWKMRKLSHSLDEKPLESVEAGKKYMWKTTVWSAIYIVVFALTVLSSTPWLWLMSIDAHWFSTMYSWYTFGSTYVAGIALITLFVVFLKNNDYLELTNQEHLHDLGKFIFAFSIFWAYLWFDQFMLIWYANIPEETTYFRPRGYGIYSGIFWLMFIINFVGPILILMSRGSKRNYATITFVSISMVFGHWLDFFQMVFPGPNPDKVPMILYDFGVALGFAGLIMYVTGRALSRSPLIIRNHPLIKESIIHHT